MNLTERARATSTLDFYEGDLNDWQQELQNIRHLITQGEISRDGDEFQEARRKIKSMLESMDVSRSFIAQKRQIEQITADVATLFSPDQQATPFDVSPEDLRLLDEDRSE
jgi:hypothetical protein